MSANHDPTPQATDVGLVLNKTTLDKHRREVDAVVTDVVHGNRDKAISGSIRLLVRALEIPVVGSALATVYERLAKSSSQAKFEAEVQEQEREEALRTHVAEAVLPTLLDCQEETRTLVETFGLAVIKRLDDLASLLSTYLTAPIQEAVSAEEAQKLQRLLDNSESLLARKRKEDEPVGALQLALITKAFGEATKKHHQATEQIAISNLESRLEAAALAVLKPGENPGELLADLQRLTGQPLRSPYYLALWNAFTKPEPGQAPPLKFEGGGARDFEAAFRQAYIAALSTPDGQRVQQWKIALSAEKPAALRHALMEDLASWGHRHVLGNVLTQSPHDILPFMPLDQVYVEPNGRLANAGESPSPIKAFIKKLLANHHLVVIKADFGNGKSLTARSLAKDLAQRWLSDHTDTGANLPLPIFVKCSRDIIGDSYNHEDSIRRALFHQGNELGVDRPMSDEMFTPPGQNQETLFILDGLDEISWGPSQVRDLFVRLSEEIRGAHRAIVFTRPGVLKNERRILTTKVSIVEVLGFDPDQVSVWIDKWNALPMQEEQLDPKRVLKTNLAEIACTPILLLLIAMTLNSSLQGDDTTIEPKRTDLYINFFEQIARGKLRQDCDEHEPVVDASDRLLTCLTDQKILDHILSDQHSERESQRIEAMLWLMSRVAWEAHERSYRENPVPLRIREIDADILDGELGLDRDVRATIELGLILTLQLDPTKGGAEEVLFGHKSFREFLVAYFWRAELRRLSRVTAQERQRIENILMKARFLQPEDSAFNMLQELLPTESKTTKDGIHAWAQEVVNNEELSARTLRDDRYSILRESALGIGSCIRPLELADPNTLRTLLAWFDVQGLRPRLFAPGLISPHANLIRAELSRANLEGAELPNADFSGANLFSADLEDANLKDANFDDACLTEAVLSQTNLDGARLYNIRRNMREQEEFLGATILDSVKVEKVAQLPRFQRVRQSNSYPSDDWANFFWALRLDQFSVSSQTIESISGLPTGAGIGSYYRASLAPSSTCRADVIEAVYDNKQHSISVVAPEWYWTIFCKLKYPEALTFEIANLVR